MSLNLGSLLSNPLDTIANHANSYLPRALSGLSLSGANELDEEEKKKKKKGLLDASPLQQQLLADAKDPYSKLGVMAGTILSGIFNKKEQQ